MIWILRILILILIPSFSFAAGIDTGTAKTADLYTGATAIGSDGFATDGLFHIDTSIDFEAQITWDTARKKPCLLIYFPSAVNLGYSTVYFEIDDVVQSEGTDYKGYWLDGNSKYLVVQTADASASDVWEIYIDVDVGITTGTAKTTDLLTGATAIGSDGFATDGLFHITGNASELTTIIWDTARKRPSVLIYPNTIDSIGSVSFEIDDVAQEEGTDYIGYELEEGYLIVQDSDVLLGTKWEITGLGTTQISVSDFLHPQSIYNRNHISWEDNRTRYEYGDEVAEENKIIIRSSGVLE